MNAPPAAAVEAGLQTGPLLPPREWIERIVKAVTPAIEADQRDKLAAVISPDQFRKLADWFDTDDKFKEAMFPETWSPETWSPETWNRQDEVQQDLRRFADLLEGSAP
ncbi:MAG: hypothetical protein ACLQFR_07650 [Streptosporangiaceae bacterium]